MTEDSEKALVEMMNKHLTRLDGMFGESMAGIIEDALEYMSRNQDHVSASVAGCIFQPGEMPTKDAVRTYSLALMIEIGEFVQELDWKAWKDKKDIDPVRIADEFADILAFLGVLIGYLKALGVSPAMLGEAYRQKSLINVQRFLGQHAPEYRRISPNQIEKEYKQDSLFKEGLE